MKKKVLEGPIGIADFGRDHWSTFAYIETLCVDGVAIDRRRMRCNPKRHPELAHTSWDRQYGTRLKGHTEHVPRSLPFHDDWDCVSDLIAAGLMKEIDPEPLFELTDKGLAIAAALRAHKARGGIFSTFNYQAKPDAKGRFYYGRGKSLV